MENPLVKKLQIKHGQKLFFINSPEYYLNMLKPLPTNVEISKNLNSNPDFIQLFIKNRKELNQYLPDSYKKLKDNGILWISYPKKNSNIETDLSRDEGWDILKELNLRPVSLISINEIWSSLRLKPVEKVKAKKEFSNVYIDKEKRIVHLPDDFKKELNQNKIAMKVFDNLSFTHKKEYVIWIVESKKDETRMKRIKSAVEKLENNLSNPSAKN
jgi:Bacteriocin-protection, YdeI or OmpD-Associated